MDSPDGVHEPRARPFGTSHPSFQSLSSFTSPGSSTPGGWSLGEGSRSSLETSPASSPVLRAKFSEESSVSPIEDSGLEPPVAPIKTICFVGAGFVGGPTAAVIAYHNPHVQVTVVDLNEQRVRAWNSAHLPIHEDGLLNVVRAARDGTLDSGRKKGRQPNLFFTTDVEKSLSQADLIFICVNTPTKTHGLGAGAMADLSAVESAARSVAQHARDGAIIVEKSTVPCGTARMIQDILRHHRPSTPFEVLSNPEFLAEGTAISNLMKPDRILIGSARTLSGLRAAAALADVYAAWVPRSRIVTVNTFSSELAKLVANAMLAQRISSINAVSALCDALGEGGYHTNGLGTADVEEVSLAIGRDARLGPRFLQAGVGFGGSCFEKDIRNLAFLARELHLDEVADYWLGVLRINEDQRRRFARGVVRALNGSLRGKKVAVLGFAFKDGTNDTRNSIAVHVISDLLGERPKEIAVFDPGCAPEDIREEIQQGCDSGGDLDKVLRVCSGWRECVQDASAVCILTPWKQFRGRQLASGVVSTRSSMGNEVRLGEDKANDGLHGVSLAEHEGMVMQQFKRLAEDETAELSDDPVDQLKPLPPCPPECTQCGHGVQSEDGKRKFHDEMVDWAEVARLMKEPRWVFDGRNIVDHAELQGMGFRVRGIGKAIYGV